MVCFRYVSVNTLHKGDDDDDDNNVYVLIKVVHDLNLQKPHTT
jgi:hypothetical protein